MLKNKIIWYSEVSKAVISSPFSSIYPFPFANNKPEGTASILRFPILSFREITLPIIKEHHSRPKVEVYYFVFVIYRCLSRSAHYPLKKYSAFYNF